LVFTVFLNNIPPLKFPIICIAETFYNGDHWDYRQFPFQDLEMRELHKNH
jgi:hypothetical protein